MTPYTELCVRLLAYAALLEETVEDAVDAFFARRAEEILRAEDGKPRYTWAQIVADIGGERGDDGTA